MKNLNVVVFFFTIGQIVLELFAKQTTGLFALLKHSIHSLAAVSYLPYSSDKLHEMGNKKAVRALPSPSPTVALKKSGVTSTPKYT